MTKNIKVKIKYNNLIAICIITVGIGFVLYSLFNIVNWYLCNKENASINEKIQESIEVVVQEDNTSNDEEEPIKEIYQIDFKTLKEQNSETKGYVKVNNTNIDYIFVQHNDNSYYLKHNFEKSWNIAGWIFGDYHNKFDGTDRNIVIFGHNTKDGSMFGTLKNVLNEDWYKNEENHIVTLVTESDTYYYQVFSTYSVKPEDYYINTEFSSDNEFNSFIKEIKSRSIYDYDVEVTEKDKILTLSSCISSGSKRVVLHAKLL